MLLGIMRMENYVTGYLKQKFCFYSLSETRNSMRQIYLWPIFYVTGCRVWRGFPHTPVISLIKYPLPPGERVCRATQRKATAAITVIAGTSIENLNGGSSFALSCSTTWLILRDENKTSQLRNDCMSKQH